MTIKNIWSLEKDTVRYKIAQQCLIYVCDENRDYSKFTDNGDLKLTVLYIDMCNANKKAINKEEQTRLKL